MKKQKTNIRQAQIKAAALQAIGQEGLRGFTIARIASQIGMTESNIYRHFRSKDELKAALVNEMGARIVQLVPDALKQEHSPAAQLKSIFFSHLEIFREHKGILRMIMSSELYGGNKMIERNLKENIGRYLAAITAILRDGIKQKVFRADLDVEAAAMMFIGLIQATALQWIMFGDYIAQGMRGDRVWEIYIKGLK